MDENNNVIVRVPEQQFIKGEDGYSPLVTIEEIEHGHSVTITDKDHPEGQSFHVLDGASAYEQAVAGGYEKSEAEFNAELANFKTLHDDTEEAAPFYAQYGVTTKEAIQAAINGKRQIYVNFNMAYSLILPYVGEIYYIDSSGSGTGYRFSLTNGTTQTVVELTSQWSSRTYDLTNPAQRAETAAAQALNRMNSADESARAAAATATTFTEQTVPAAVQTVTTAKNEAVGAVNTAKDAAILALGQKSTDEQAAIQQKGEDVLDELQDYADLPGEVDNLKSALECFPDTYDNLVNPVKTLSNGLSWSNGVLTNNLVDTKSSAQIYVQIISKSGSVTTVGSAVTEAGRVERVGYCNENTAYIQIRHNGETRDLYARFPVSLDHGSETIISFDLKEITPNIVGGIVIENVKASLFMTSKWAASLDNVHHLYIPADSVPVITSSGDSAVVKISVNPTQVFTNIPDFGKTVTVNQVLADLPNNANYEDNLLTIIVPTRSILFYDFEHNKMLITRMTSNDIPGKNCLALITNFFGAGPYGDWVDRASYHLSQDTSAKIAAINYPLGYPDYYENAINDVTNKLAKMPTNNFNYLLFTDIHYSYPNTFTAEKLSHLISAIKRITDGSNIDAVIFAGDLIEGGYAANKVTSDNQINAVLQNLGKINKPVLCAFGNHDNNMYNWNTAPEDSRNTDHYITTAEWINKGGAPFGNYADYYYVDFSAKQMRVIISNTCDYEESVDADGEVSIDNYSEIMIRQTQVDDIAQMLFDSPYDIVVVAHGLAAPLFSVISRYNTRATYTTSSGNVINYAGATHKVRLYHTGHYHNNAMQYISGYNVNAIATSCASMAPEQQTLYSASPTGLIQNWQDTGPIAYNQRVIPRVLNTITETCFDVVSIAADKITKFGVGGDNDGVLNS